MTRELRVSLAIVKKMFQGDVSFEGGEQVLGSNTVSGFVENDRQELFRFLKETQKKGKFGNGIERTTGVPANTTSSASRGEVDDGVSEEVDVGKEISSLGIGQDWVGGIERNLFVKSMQINTEFLCHNELKIRPEM